MYDPLTFSLCLFPSLLLNGGEIPAILVREHESAMNKIHELEARLTCLVGNHLHE